MPGLAARRERAFLCFFFNIMLTQSVSQSDLNIELPENVGSQRNQSNNDRQHVHEVSKAALPRARGAFIHLQPENTRQRETDLKGIKTIKHTTGETVLPRTEITSMTKGTKLPNTQHTVIRINVR